MANPQLSCLKELRLEKLCRLGCVLIFSFFSHPLSFSVYYYFLSCIEFSILTNYFFNISLTLTLIFVLRIVFLFLGCGGMLNGSSGSFGTPGYPLNYDNNLNCVWTLLIPIDRYLRLKFIVFHTEKW